MSESNLQWVSYIFTRYNQTAIGRLKRSTWKTGTFCEPSESRKEIENRKRINISKIVSQENEIFSFTYSLLKNNTNYELWKLQKRGRIIERQ